jgi:NADPH:quinone reductase
VHAVRLHAFGPAENLRYEEIPDPAPGADQVRIRAEVSGVHLIDTTLRRGVAMGPLPLPDLPAIPGREVAGVADAVGPDVDERLVGRRVVAHLGAASGGYAELAVAPAGALHEVPDHVPSDVAVAMIGTGRTAVGILDAAALTGDDAVLVTAAAGGLGTLFVQAARNVGAVAVGVAGGPEKVDRVRASGAEVAVDYLEPDWPDRVRDALGDRDVSVVLDGVGGEAGRAAMELLGVGGRT